MHPAKTYDAADFAAPADLARVQRGALVAAGVGFAGLAAGFFVAPAYFYRSYLVGWVLCMSVTLGALALCMLNHMTHGAWGITARRMFEAAMRTLPWLFLLFLPIALGGMKELYPWTHPELVRGDKVLEAKSGYLNTNAFFVRFVLYFALWGFLSWRLDRLSRQQDERSTPQLSRRLQATSGPGIVAFCLSITFAAVDWVMSLQPHWYSTIYGFYLIACSGLAAIAFVILFARFLAARAPMAEVLQPPVFHDWGNLLFTFNMLWAYFCFSQFLITWSGNLPEEISWFMQRMHHGWGWVGMLLVLGHFALPFSLLLSRARKRHAARLARVAAILFVMRIVDYVWQVEPAFKEQNPAYYWLYAAAPLGLFGLWLALFLREYRKRPLLPVNDPYLPESIAYEH